MLRVERALRRDGTIAEPKTARSRRAVTLTPDTAALFGRLIAGKSPDDLVFTAPDGGPWKAGTLRQRYWQRAVIAAQRCPQHPPVAAASGWVSPRAVSTCHCPGRLRVRPRLQNLRHTHVAYLIATGWDFLAIQLRLGHASIRTTFDVYGHLLPHGERSRLAVLDVRMPFLQHLRALGYGEPYTPFEQPICRAAWACWAAESRRPQDESSSGADPAHQKVAATVARADHAASGLVARANGTCAAMQLRPRPFGTPPAGFGLTTAATDRGASSDVSAKQAVPADLLLRRRRTR